MRIKERWHKYFYVKLPKTREKPWVTFGAQIYFNKGLQKDGVFIRYTPPSHATNLSQKK